MWVMTIAEPLGYCPVSPRDRIEPAGELDAARLGAPEKPEMCPSACRLNEFSGFGVKVFRQWCRCCRALPGGDRAAPWLGKRLL